MLKLFSHGLQGRSNSFPGKRRPRGAGGARGRGGRSRLKAMASCIDAFLVSYTLYIIQIAWNSFTFYNVVITTVCHFIKYFCYVI